MSIPVFVLLFALSLDRPASPAAQAFVGVTVVPMDAPRSLPDRTVIVRDGRIEAIVDAGAPLPPDAVRIEGKGRYLIPGLIDCYSHVDGTPHLVPYLANGITTVKDSPAPIEHLGLRDRVSRGELIGPTILCSSTDLDGIPEYPTVEAITSPARAEPIVAEMARLGYDGLMVYSGLSRDVYVEIIAAADRHGLPVTGHVSPLGNVAVLANGSQRSVENLVGFIDFETGEMAFNETTARAVARILRNGQVACVPTLTVHKVRGASARGSSAATGAEFRFFPESMRAGLDGSSLIPVERYRYGGARRLVQIFHEEGVVLLFGTDAGYPRVLPGFSAHGPNGELANLVDAGLTPFEALSAATRSAAEFLRLESEIGTIAPGRRADLVLLDADPLADTGNVARIAGVMVRGRYFPKSELEALLEEQAARYSLQRDRFAALPALPTSGSEEVAATYEIGVGGDVVGTERITRRRLEDGGSVLTSQSSIDPWWDTRTCVRLETDKDGVDRSLEVERESVDGKAHIRIERHGERSRATGSRPAFGAIDFDEPLAPGTLFGGPILSNGLASDMAANFVHVLPSIADMAVGDTRELHFRLIELNSCEFFRNATLGDMTWTIRRAADTTAPTLLRVFEITTNGRAGRGGYVATILIEPDASAPREIRAGEGQWQPWTYRRL